MRIAVITDISRLYDKTMYLNQVENEARKIGVEMDVFTVKIPALLAFDNEVPLVRLLKASSLIGAVGKCDIIHTQFTLPLGFLFTLLKGLHQEPVVIHTHGYDVFKDVGIRRLKIGDFFSKLTWKAASQIIAVCKKTKQVILKEGIEEDKVTILYNGVDEALFRRKKTVEDREYLSVREKGGFVLLNVGNLVEVKNQARLLVAFKRFLKDGEKNRDVRLAICGDGYLKERLQRFSHQLHIDKDVFFLGKVPHSKMPDVYNVSDAFILPSLSEAHPWSLLEAMSCELPVAASRVGGVTETLGDERFLFDPSNVHEITEAISRLVENVDENKALGLRNRKIVLNRFTLRRHALNLKSIYVNLLEKTPV